MGHLKTYEESVNFSLQREFNSIGFTKYDVVGLQSFTADSCCIRWMNQAMANSSSFDGLYIPRQCLHGSHSSIRIPRVRHVYLWCSWLLCQTCLQRVSISGIISLCRFSSSHYLFIHCFSREASLTANVDFSVLGHCRKYLYPFHSVHALMAQSKFLSCLVWQLYAHKRDISPCAGNSIVPLRHVAWLTTSIPLVESCRETMYSENQVRMINVWMFARVCRNWCQLPLMTNGEHKS
jgi:hypothetical protein